MSAGDRAFFQESVRIISTGGGRPDRLDDTIDGISRARQMGARACRTNVGVTADGHAVIFSDAVIATGLLKRRPLSAMTLAEIRTAYGRHRSGDAVGVPAGDLFPLLDDVFNALADYRFVLNIHDPRPDAAEPLLQVVSRTRVEERVLFTTPNGPVMRRAAERCPGAAQGLPFSKTIALYALHRSGFLFLRKRIRADALVIPEAIGISYFASRPLIDEMHHRGLPTIVLGVSDVQQLTRVFESGADAFIAADVVLVKEFLRGRAES